MSEIIFTFLGYAFIFAAGVVIMFFGGLGASPAWFFGGMAFMFASGFSLAFNNLPKFFDVSQPLISVDIMGATASLSINFALSVVAGIVTLGLGYYLLFGRKEKSHAAA